MESTNWFCLYLGTPQAEFAARDAILSLGMESFVPVEFKTVQRRPGNSPHARFTRKRKAYPLCIRYGFVGFPRGARWPDLLADHPDMPAKVIRGTNIPARPVGMTPLKPTELQHDQISYLASLSDRYVPYAASINPHKALVEIRKGQVAKILSPAFYGHVGRVDDVTANKARVLIEFLGSMRPVEVRIEDLEAA